MYFRLPYKQEVAGSSPALPTKIPNIYAALSDATGEGYVYRVGPGSPRDHLSLEKRS